MNAIHTMTVNVFGTTSRITAVQGVTPDMATEVLWHTRRLLMYTVYMYTEVARSYSRDVADYLRKNRLLRDNTRKYLALTQRALDETLRIMRENAVKEVFIDYSDTFYFSLQTEFEFLRQSLDHELEFNGLEKHTPLSWTYTLHNLVNFAVDSHHSLMRKMKEMYGIDLSRPFRQWKPDGAERWCREVNASLYGPDGDKCVSDTSTAHKQTVFAFNRLVDRITNYDAMKQAAHDVVNDLPDEVRQKYEKTETTI